MVVFDASFLIPLIATSPVRPNKQNPLSEAGTQRFEYLLTTLEKSREVVLIPAPALAEILVRATSLAAAHLEALENRKVFRIEAFDQIAAVECAVMMRKEFTSNRATSRKLNELSRGKIKFDLQIVAIAKTRGAGIIYSNDRGMRTAGKREGMTVLGFEELPKPPPENMELPFDPADKHGD